MISENFPMVKALIIDMDGVLWHDTQPIGDLPAIFNRIKTLGFKFILATNNATRTVAEYHTKLADFGVELEKGQVINAAEAVGIYLKEHYPQGTPLYVVGQPSLKHTLESYGFLITEEDTSDAKVVIASLDYSLTYDKLKTASLLIQSGCDFIGSNPDVTLPTPEGFIPGSGTVISALEIASGKRAKIIGKPEPLLYQMALKMLGVLPEQTLAIGDRLETDIAGAHAAGIHSALVLCGASSLAQAKIFDPKPDLIVRDLTELIK